MAGERGKLTDLQLRHWVKAGVPLAKADGGGLTFTLSAGGSAGWILRYNFGGRRLGKAFHERTSSSISRRWGPARSHASTAAMRATTGPVSLSFPAHC